MLTRRASISSVLYMILYTDTCYILSFSIIMLNTSLHNPNVKPKPDLDQFVSMVRGINDGGDLPRDLLESIFDSIKREPFKMTEDDGNELNTTFFNPDKEGWLWKQGKHSRKRADRHCKSPCACIYMYDITMLGWWFRSSNTRCFFICTIRW